MEIDLEIHQQTMREKEFDLYHHGGGRETRFHHYHHRGGRGQIREKSLAESQASEGAVLLYWDRGRSALWTPEVDGEVKLW